MFLGLWTHQHFLSVLSLAVTWHDTAGRNSHPGGVCEPGGGTGGRLHDGQRSMWLKCLHAKMGVQHERWSPVHIKEAPFISQWHNKYESLLPNTTLLMTVLDTAVSRAAYQMCSVFTIWIACKKAQLLYSSLREKTDFSEAIDIQWVLFLPIKKEVKGVDFCRYVHKRNKGRNN